MTDSRRPEDDVRIVEIYSAANEIEAAAVRAALDAEGILSRVVGDRLGNAWGELPLGYRSEPKVWVREPDLEAARAVIHRWQERPDAGTDEIDEAWDVEGERKNEANERM